jgi:hypothetical protein
LFISQELSRRHWTVEILRGEFAKFREPSDHAEEQGSYGKPIFKFKFKGNRAVGSKPVRAVGSLANSHFTDSRAEGSKTLHQDSRDRERRSPVRVRSFVVGPSFITHWNSTPQKFRRIGGRDFCPESPEVASCDKEYRGVRDLGTSGVRIQRRQHFGGSKSRSAEAGHEGHVAEPQGGPV